MLFVCKIIRVFYLTLLCIILKNRQTYLNPLINIKSALYDRQHSFPRYFLTYSAKESFPNVINTTPEKVLSCFCFFTRFQTVRYLMRIMRKNKVYLQKCIC